MNRDKLIKSNISIGLLYKVLSLTTIYISIPFLMEFLGTTNYGIWITLYSSVSILFFLDGGLSNGLRTKLAEAIGKDDHELGQKYITASYVTITAIAIAFLSIGLLLVYTFSLRDFFEIQELIEEAQLKKVFVILLGTIVLNFILSQYKSLFFAIQKSKIVEFSVFIYQILVLISVIIGMQYLNNSLIYVALVYGFASLLIGMYFTFYFFKTSPFKIVFQFLEFSKVKELLSLGSRFFIIQICMIIVFTSDNILTMKLLGPDSVAAYDTHYKMYHLFITFSVIFLDPFWTMFSDAYQKNEILWIKKTFKKLNIFFLLLAIVIIIFTLFSKTLFTIWVGERVEYSFLLASLFALCVLIRIFGMIYMYFLNGIGKISIQMWLYGFGAIINIPLSIFFVKSFQMNSEGIILGTICSILGLSTILPFQVFKIIRNRTVILKD